MMVRALTAADAEIFREIRLECLRLHPGAFGSTLADWEPKTIAQYAARIVDGVLFGLFDGKDLIGTLAYDREKGGNARHRAGIHAVYVKAQYRGQGGIDLLLEAAVEQAMRDSIDQLELSVSADNPQACEAYRRHGFVTFGRIPRALRVAGVYVDEILMMRDLTGA